MQRPPFHEVLQAVDEISRGVAFFILLIKEIV
jgi:hypothetical protein